MSTSKRWLDEHHSDAYVKKAKEEGLRSRAAYKLLELQKKDRLIKPGMTVVDLGAAPGGWSVVAKELVGKKGQVIALDILPMDSIPDVTFIEGDFTDQSVLDALLNAIDNKPVDIVISDMAPNISGQKSVDQPKSLYLVELALDCAKQVLRPGGSFLAKVFQGEGSDALVAELKKAFRVVKIRKPKASRPRSREIYVVCLGFHGIL